MFELMTMAPKSDALSLFYGGSLNVSSKTAALNKVTRVNSNGSLEGVESNVGLARCFFSGAGYTNDLSLFYTGSASGTLRDPYYNTVTRLSSAGTMIGSEFNIGTSRHGIGAAGMTPTLALFYGGNGESYLNTVQRLNHLGVLINSITSVGTKRSHTGGTSVRHDRAIFHGGHQSGTGRINKTTVITDTGSLATSETNVGSTRSYSGTASLKPNVCMYYGGAGPAETTNTVRRFNSLGVTLGAETTAGAKVVGPGGSGVNGNLAFFYAGLGSVNLSTLTKINASGVLINNSTSLGTARQYLTGASLR